MKIRDENAARNSDAAVYFSLFDLTHLAGYDISHLPLYKRKSLLKQLFTYNNRVRYTSHGNQRSDAYPQEARRKGRVGLIAKKRDSVYSHRRSGSRRKLKCVHRQQFLIIRYTEPRGTGTGFGALLIGDYEGNGIRYAGKVGTGFTEDTLNSISEMLFRQRREQRRLL